MSQSVATLRAIAVAVKYYKRWDDACPDVGMGPTIDMLLDGVLTQARIKLTPTERTSVLQMVARKER